MARMRLGCVIYFSTDLFIKTKCLFTIHCVPGTKPIAKSHMLHMFHSYYSFQVTSKEYFVS
jgi:hypothetical protein